MTLKVVDSNCVGLTVSCWWTVTTTSANAFVFLKIIVRTWQIDSADAIGIRTARHAACRASEWASESLIMFACLSSIDRRHRCIVVRSRVISVSVSSSSQQSHHTPRPSRLWSSLSFESPGHVEFHLRIGRVPVVYSGRSRAQFGRLKPVELMRYNWTKDVIRRIIQSPHPRRLLCNSMVYEWKMYFIQIC